MVEIYPRPIIEHYLTSYSSKDRGRKVFMKSYLNFDRLVMSQDIFGIFAPKLDLLKLTYSEKATNLTKSPC